MLICIGSSVPYAAGVSILVTWSAVWTSGRSQEDERQKSFHHLFGMNNLKFVERLSFSNVLATRRMPSVRASARPDYQYGTRTRAC